MVALALELAVRVADDERVLLGDDVADTEDVDVGVAVCVSPDVPVPV